MISLCSKNFYFFFLLLVISIGASAQTGGIRGTVKTSDGKPGELVSVALQGTTKGATVSPKGDYQIKNITPGHYTIVASFIGLNTQSKEVDVLAGQTLINDFVLTENNSQLQEVIITSGRNNKFTRQTSQDVGKLPLKNLENPQVYAVVTSELMKEQQVTNISQALSNVAGVAPSKDPAGGTSFTLRGFTQEVAARNGVLFIGGGRSGVDPVNVDHFEVLKGPSAVLYGNTVSSYGGAINMVTKKPYDHFGGEVSYFLGGFDLNRVTIDVNTPLNADKTLLLRTNAAMNKEQSYLDQGHNNTFTFDPSLLYKVNDKLTLSMDLEIYREDLTKTPYLQFGALNISNVNQIPLDYTKTLYDDGLNAVANTFRTFFTAKYKINEHWYSQTDLAVNNEKVDHSYQYYPTFLTATTIQRNIALYSPIVYINTDLQHNLHGDFNIGKMRNRFVWGIDYFRSAGNFSSIFTKVDVIDITQPYGTVNKLKADSALAHQTLDPSKFSQYNAATYVSDLVNLTDNLMALLSARVDRYHVPGPDGYNQTSFTPKLGLIYQPIKDRISLFGNYMSGFTNNGPTQQPDGTITIFKPEYGTQWEGGVKLNNAAGNLSATLSYYNINVRDALRYAGDGFTYQDGKQKSNGFDISVTANPFAGFNIIAGYVYNKNQYTRQEEGVGKDQPGTPRNIANLWVSYKIQPGSILQDFGIGFGGNYAQKSFYNLDNTVTIPGYTLLNSTVFYDNSKWHAGISVNNLANKKYWSPSFTANPQPLRQIIANVALKF